MTILLAVICTVFAVAAPLALLAVAHGILYAVAFVEVAVRHALRRRKV